MALAIPASCSKFVGEAKGYEEDEGEISFREPKGLSNIYAGGAKGSVGKDYELKMCAGGAKGVRHTLCVKHWLIKGGEDDA
eukprot:4280651-Karenia_brevis.AAC.1